MFKLNKRGGVFAEHIPEIIGVVIVLLIIGLALTVFNHASSDISIKAKIEEVSVSRVCDIGLINFLRADSGAVLDGDTQSLPSLHGITAAQSSFERTFTFAELLAIASDNPAYAKKFEDATTVFMNNNYRRWDNSPSQWRITVKDIGAPRIFGTLEKASELDICSKTVPSREPELPISIELALEH